MADDDYNRSLTTRLEDARKSGDWVAHERLWGERRIAEVRADEARLAADLDEDDWDEEEELSWEQSPAAFDRLCQLEVEGY